MPSPAASRFEIQAGGRSLIRVTDDGTGMSRDDALLCLERHATSKIHRAEDLSAIATMGFRGEALPSIASVRRMTLTTREREGAPAAARRLSSTAANCSRSRRRAARPGPPWRCANCFSICPLVRKFLRSEETEYSHIHHYLTLAALAYPESRFHPHQGHPSGMATARGCLGRQTRRAADGPCANGCGPFTGARQSYCRSIFRPRCPAGPTRSN